MDAKIIATMVTKHQQAFDKDKGGGGTLHSHVFFLVFSWFQSWFEASFKVVSMGQDQAV